MVALLLASCRMEKRLYTKGYYFSSAKREKVQHTPIPDKKPVDAVVMASAGTEKSVIEPLAFEDAKLLPDQAVIEKDVVKKRSVKLPSRLTDSESPTPAPAALNSEKQSHYFLLASILTFLGSLGFGSFLVAGNPPVAYTIFIFTIFGIIGLWIYGLILKQQIDSEGESGMQGKEGRGSQYYSQQQATRLAQFLGIFGAHRFYLGYFWMGILQLFTLGGFFILAIRDYFRIKASRLNPKNGVYDNSWQKVAKKSQSDAPANKFLRWGLWISALAALALFAFVLFL